MTTRIPSEFVGFIREAGVKAFDRLALRAKELDAPLRSFVRSWSRLSNDEKNTLFDELIDSARMPEPSADVPPEGLKQKRPVKRYDPEEVAATLPKKPAPRKKAKKKTK